MLVNYNGEDFKEITKELCLIDFNASWCGPCRMLSPELEKVSDSIKVIKVDTDEYSDLAREFGIMSIPCLVLMKDSKEIKRSLGFIPEDEIRKFIEL